MKVLCECNSFLCAKMIDLPLHEVQKAKKNPNAVIILNGCPTGPESTDTLLTKESGYSLYEQETPS